MCLLGTTIFLDGATPQQPPGEDQDVTLPSGKSQKEEILREEHKKNLRDVGEIIEVAGQLKTELEKNDYQVLSISAIKKTERIEKLARQVKSRIRR